MSTPHPLIPTAACAGILVASYPSLLPRSPLVAALVTALFCAAGTLLATALVGMRERRHGARPVCAHPVCAHPVCARAGRTALATATVVSVGATVAGGHWQALLRDEIAAATGTPPTGPLFAWQWAAVVAGPALAVGAAIIWCPRVTAIGAALVAALVCGHLSVADAWARSPRAPGQVLYSPLPSSGESASDLDRRARALADRWTRAHPDPGSPLVIAVPTGSGWVDPDMVDGVRLRWGPRVTMLALQYADAPSWRVFTADRDSAGRSAITLLRAVIAAAPRDGLPPIYLYGQSLGAVGADDAREWAQTHARDAIAGTVLAGMPAGSVAARSATPRTIIANHSDPVTRWSPALLWRPARSPDNVIPTGPRLSAPPWLPVVSFVQTSIDLIASLDGPAGTGHSYGTGQGRLIGPPAERHPTTITSTDR